MGLEALRSCTEAETAMLYILHSIPLRSSFAPPHSERPCLAGGVHHARCRPQAPRSLVPEPTTTDSYRPRHRVFVQAESEPCTSSPGCTSLADNAGLRVTTQFLSIEPHPRPSQPIFRTVAAGVSPSPLHELRPDHAQAGYTSGLGAGQPVRPQHIHTARWCGTVRDMPPVHHSRLHAQG